METKQLLQILEELQNYSFGESITDWILAVVFLDIVKVAIHCRGPGRLTFRVRDCGIQQEFQVFRGTNRTHPKIHLLEWRSGGALGERCFWRKWA